MWMKVFRFQETFLTLYVFYPILSTSVSNKWFQYTFSPRYINKRWDIFLALVHGEIILPKLFFQSSKAQSKFWANSSSNILKQCQQSKNVLGEYWKVKKDILCDFCSITIRNRITYRSLNSFLYNMIWWYMRFDSGPQKISKSVRNTISGSKRD